MSDQPHHSQGIIRSETSPETSNLLIRESVALTERDLACLRQAVNDRFREVDKRIDRVNRRIDSFQQLVILGLLWLCLALVVGASVGLLLRT